LRRFRLLTFLPMIHTAEECRRFVTNVILKECAVTVAEDDSGIVSFLALRGEEVRLLYTRPDPHWARGGNAARRGGEIERGRGARNMVLSSQHSGASLL
jgi:hypothetical protein